MEAAAAASTQRDAQSAQTAAQPHQEEDQQKMVEVGARSAQRVGDDAHTLVERQHLGGGVAQRAREQTKRIVRRATNVLRLSNKNPPLKTSTEAKRAGKRSSSSHAQPPEISTGTAQAWWWWGRPSGTLSRKAPLLGALLLAPSPAVENKKQRAKRSSRQQTATVLRNIRKIKIRPVLWGWRLPQDKPACFARGSRPKNRPRPRWGARHAWSAHWKDICSPCGLQNFHGTYERTTRSI